MTLRQYIYRSTIMLALVLITAASATSQLIRIDGVYDDWSEIDPIYTDELGDGQNNGIDFEKVWITNDQANIYIRFELNKEIDLQEDNELALYLDFDDNFNTGFKINGIGAEVRYIFGDRTGIITSGGDTDFVNFVPIGLLAAPTVTGTEFELTIRREITSFDLVAGPVISIRLEDNSFNGDEAPSALTGIDYTIDNGQITSLPAVDLSASNGADIRFLSYNIEDDQLFEPQRRDYFRRIFQAINPDIIALQEVRDFNSTETRDLIEEFLPGTWYHRKHGFDIVTISRYPFNFTENINGNAAFFIDVDGREILLINCHLPCCDNDGDRQAEVDGVMRYIRDARAGQTAYRLLDGTPLLIAGDMNFVGDRNQPYTFTTGDILNNGTYGPDFSPDYDGTDLAEVDATATHTISNFTWFNPFGSFLAGKLDWTYYTDSNMSLLKTYALWTPAMTDSQLAAYGLDDGDVPNAADHLPLVSDFRFDPVSVDDYVEIDLTIHPNPATHQISISSSQILVDYIDILSAEGVKVMRTVADRRNTQTVDIRSLPSGQYYMIMQTEVGRVAKAFLKI